MTTDPKRSRGDKANTSEIAKLRGRTLLMLSAIEREEPGPQWASLRIVVENAEGVSDLRAIHREMRALLAAMSPLGRELLEHELSLRFGPDARQERDETVVAKVRSTGRIRTEREYRIVQAYVDSLPPTASERDALGALLDDFMAAP
jgi:hypothetical protein